MAETHTEWAYRSGDHLIRVGDWEREAYHRAGHPDDVFVAQVTQWERIITKWGYGSAGGIKECLMPRDAVHYAREYIREHDRTDCRVWRNDGDGWKDVTNVWL